MTPITGPGFHEMPASRYHADPAPKISLSSGFLATIVTKTVAAAVEGHPKLNPNYVEVDNKKFDLGSVAHTLVLGKGDEIAPLDFGDYKTKAAQAARDEAIAEGKQPCLLSVYENAEAMRDALFLQLGDMPSEHETFSPEHGVAELPGFAQLPVLINGTERRLWGRCLPDWRATSGDLRIRDYKTYAGQLGADPGKFIRGLIETGKDIQDPWYSTICAAILAEELGEPIEWSDIDFRFIVQDPKPPYLVSVVALDDRRWSYERMRWALDRWGAAAGAKLYRGFTPITHYVRVPTYARIQWEERMMNEFEAEQALAEDGKPHLQLQDPETYRVPNPDEIQGSDTGEPEEHDDNG